MATIFTSGLHTFSIDDITGTFDGQTVADDAGFIDTSASVMPSILDKDGNTLYGLDSEFGYYVQDFLGAEQKVIDGDYAEGFAGNIYNSENPTEILGLSVKNAVTDQFRSALPLGTWALGLGGATVKASTEHYTTMANLLSDQAYPGDASAIFELDNDLRLADMQPTGPDGAYEPGLKHNLYVDELTEALQRAIDNIALGANPTVYTDLDLDHDGTLDTFTTRSVQVDYDSDGDGIAEPTLVGGVDINVLNGVDVNDGGVADIVDNPLNGLGGTADLVDLLVPNEATITENIAFSSDYSVTLKDDGKLLYRWGSTVKKPNDVRMEVKLDLPEEWTADADGNGVADSLENGHAGYVITKAVLVVDHDITNNPNDQIRPEDYENEAAIGRLPSYYVVTDPDDPENTLWVSPLDSYNGEGDALPSYFKLDEVGQIDMTATGIAVYDPDGVLVGYRNTDAEGALIGTVFRDESLAALNAAADLSFSSEDITDGFTAAWYTTTDREPFEWSYDTYSDDPYKQVYVSFRTPEEAAAEGYHEDTLVSGPRWRLTPNKFGQDLPGLEVPLEPNSQPPFQKDNIKYDTGERITTTLNLLDWEDEDSPLLHSSGWMLVDPARLDVDLDGVIDEGWSYVNGTLGAGDLLPTGPIFDAVTPNGINLGADTFDTAVYIKGDRQDSAKIYNMQLVLEYDLAPIATELLINAESFPIESFGPQQDFGTAELSPDGASLTVSDNGWKIAMRDTTVSSDTVLSFDFDASEAAEIYGIAFETDGLASKSTTFQLAGSQTFGIQNFDSYDIGSGTTHFDIQVGAFFTGEFDRIVFITDDDAGGGGAGTFSNITLADTAGALMVNDDAFTITSFGPQQDFGTAEMSADGTSLTVSDNGWKIAMRDTTVTADTVIAFDFEAGEAAEIYGIAFENDGLASSEFTFQFAGSQTFGIQAHNTYDIGSGTERFEIAVGDYFTGDFDRIVFITDDDAHGGGEATFSNVTIYDDPVALTELAFLDDAATTFESDFLL